MVYKKIKKWKNQRIKLTSHQRTKRDTHTLCGLILIFSIIASLYILVDLPTHKNSHLTGFAISSGVAPKVDDVSTTTITNQTLSFIEELYLRGNATRGEAQLAITSAELMIDDLKFLNITTSFVTDQLALAKQDFQNAEYSETLTNGTEDLNQIKKAKAELKKLDLKSVEYDEVIMHTREIEIHAERSYKLLDGYTSIELLAKDYKKQNINISDGLNLLAQSKVAFQEDRYDEAEDLLTKSRESLNKAKAEFTILSALKEGGKGFLRRNWLQLIIVISILSILGYISANKYKKFTMVDHLEYLKSEKKALKELMKKLQKEHFVDKKIPKVIYEIRMEKYKSRFREIETKIPALESAIKHKKINLKNVEISPKGTGGLKIK